MKLSTFILLCGFICNLSVAQEVPSIPCPNIFQYLRYGNQYIGRIELQLEQPVNELYVEFSQRYPLQSQFVGNLGLFDDEETTKANLRSGRPVSYRVDFPTPGVLPKLTLIQLNGVILCTGSEYPRPNTIINLTHMLRSSTYFVSRPNPLDENPPFYYDQTRRPSFRPQFVPNAINSNPPSDFNINIIPAPSIPSNTPIPVQILPAQTSTVRPIQSDPTTIRTRVPSPVSPNSANDLDSVCGREGNNIVPFIHFGSVIARGQFPWLTAIYQKVGAGLKFICGGSLVSRRTVITAAHCFKLTGLTANRVLIYLGRHNLDDYSENGIAAREVLELVNHPDYNTNSYPDADLAMVHLQLPVDFTQFIKPICLWSERYDLVLPRGQKGYIAGWGGDEKGAEITNLPKMVDANIVDEAECLRSLEVKDLTSNRTLCAGNRDGSGPCMGDSGGGLMLSYNNVWILRGVVSAGQVVDQRCNLREYVIYCDIAKHITWIRQNIRD